MKFIIGERSNPKRVEKTGKCYKSDDGLHYYLVRENDVLHVTDNLINSLEENVITSNRIDFNEKFNEINRAEFNGYLNKTIFELDYFGDEYRTH